MHIEHAQNRGAGGRDALHGRAGGVDGRIAEERERGGRGNRQRAVRALDRAAADIERRGEPAIDAERFASGGGADDVDDGVDRADFVKVNFFDGHGVDRGFSFAEQLKGAAGAVFYRLSKRRGSNDGEDRGERAVGVIVGVLV